MLSQLQSKAKTTEMDYSLDFWSGMSLGDLELFPECVLGAGLTKDEPGSILKDPPKSKDLNIQPPLSLDDDVFPDWLDLKMDFSFLEGTETPEAALDDLLLGEAGQLMDDLPTPMLEDKLPSMDLEQLPFMQPSPPLASIASPPPTTTPPVAHDIWSPQTPPSSPDWIVPDVRVPSSPVSLLSPISEPTSPGCNVVAPSEATVITFVAPIVQPVTLVDTNEVIVEPAPLNNLLNLSFLLSGISNDMKIEEAVSSSPAPSLELSPVPSPSSSVEYERPKTERKRKAATNRRPKSAKSKAVPCESDSDTPMPTTKKERKRKQNKDAAMRYRIKKRMEGDVLADEEGVLLQENQALKDKAKQLASELGYLKNLMREMFKAKGLLK